MAASSSSRDMERPAVISIMIKAEVSGARVTPARTAVMPTARISGRHAGSARAANQVPMPAPTDSDGVNMPPGRPLSEVARKPTNFSGIYSQETCSWPCSSLKVSSEPLPKMGAPRPAVATTRAQSSTKT